MSIIVRRCATPRIPANANFHRRAAEVFKGPLTWKYKGFVFPVLGINVTSSFAEYGQNTISYKCPSRCLEGRAANFC